MSRPSRTSLNEPLKYAFFMTYLPWMIQLLRENCAFIISQSISHEYFQCYIRFFSFSFFRTEATWCSSQFDSRVTGIYPIYVCPTCWLPEWWSESKVVANINDQQHQKSIKGQFMFNKIFIMNIIYDGVCAEVLFLPWHWAKLPIMNTFQC